MRVLRKARVCRGEGAEETALVPQKLKAGRESMDASRTGEQHHWVAAEDAWGTGAGNWAVQVAGAGPQGPQ